MQWYDVTMLKLQEKDLREVFPTLAFRTSEKTFTNDMNQISAVAQENDFLIVDLEDYCLSEPDDMATIRFMIDHLKTFD